MSYIGAEPDGMGKAQRFTFTASGSGTDVTADDDGIPIGYTVGQVSVYLNGVKQVIGSGKDVTATDGSTITFLAAYAADDVIEVVALSIFSATTVEGTALISTGATSSDTVTLAGHLTVNGTTTTINSTTLTVDDKNIEMGSVASPTDSTADGGGITLKGTTDKTIVWENDTNQWNINQKWSENAGSSAWHRPLTTMLGLG